MTLEDDFEERPSSEQEEPTTGKLVDAVRSGNIREVITALQLGASADEKASEWAAKEHPRGLQIAASGGKADIVEVLLKTGADVKRTVGNGYSALDYAVFGHKYECAELLVEWGADVRCKNGDGQSPLELAQKQKDARMLAILER